MPSPPSTANGLGDRIEESLIAFFLGAMALIAFANAIARLMDSNILWALAATVFPFAWLVLIGVPIAVALGFSSIGFLLIGSDASLASVAQTLLSAFTGHYTLLAIPFFVLASGFISTGGVAKRIIRFAIAVVGQVRVFYCQFCLQGHGPAVRCRRQVKVAAEKSA